MSRWIFAPLLAAFAAAIFFRAPASEEVAQAGVDAPTPVERGPHSVVFGAEPAAAAAPFTETWQLSYPVAAPVTQRLTLSFGDATPGASVPARFTATEGDPTVVLERIAEVMGGAATARLAPVPALDAQMVPLGSRLSLDSGSVVGTTVIAGAFVAEPAGDWRAFRVTFGAGGPQCFLALGPIARQAMLLLRDPADGPAIHGRFQALLGPRPAAS